MTILFEENIDGSEMMPGHWTIEDSNEFGYPFRVTHDGESICITDSFEKAKRILYNMSCH